MSKQFRPLLASPVDLDKLDFKDLWVSPKLDGIRATVIDGVLMSRTLKPIPNKHVQNMFRHLEHFDGELIAGDPTSPSAYRDTYSAVMSEDGEPEVTFYAFDHTEAPQDEYASRYLRLVQSMRNEGNLVVLEQFGVSCMQDLDSLESAYLEQGYEGLMLRRSRGPNSHYKFGRSTTKEGILLKLKRMASDEARVIDMVEIQRNMNEATTDALGHTQRSSHKENKVAGGVMGTLVVECLTTGVKFEIGTGFTAEDRRVMWNTKDQVIGKIVTYNHFPIGRKDLPRHPSFKGFRSEIDL